MLTCTARKRGAHQPNRLNGINGITAQPFLYLPSTTILSLSLSNQLGTPASMFRTPECVQACYTLATLPAEQTEISYQDADWESRTISKLAPNSTAQHNGKRIRFPLALPCFHILTTVSITLCSHHVVIFQEFFRLTYGF